MKRIVATIISLVVGTAMVGAALLYTPTKAGESSERVSAKQLAANTGVGGKECWVAVDGDVYVISGFSQWQMGRHTPSNGKASCGRDLTSVMPESPHGKSVLQLLKKIGTYKG